MVPRLLHDPRLVKFWTKVSLVLFQDDAIQRPRNDQHFNFSQLPLKRWLHMGINCQFCIWKFSWVPFYAYCVVPCISCQVCAIALEIHFSSKMHMPYTRPACAHMKYKATGYSHDSLGISLWGIEFHVETWNIILKQLNELCDIEIRNRKVFTLS